MINSRYRNKNVSCISIPFLLKIFIDPERYFYYKLEKIFSFMSCMNKKYNNAGSKFVCGSPRPSSEKSDRKYFLLSHRQICESKTTFCSVLRTRPMKAVTMKNDRSQWKLDRFKCGKSFCRSEVMTRWRAGRNYLPALILLLPDCMLHFLVAAN